MSSVPASDVADTPLPARPERVAPHVRTYLLACVVSLVLFFPTAIPGIVACRQSAPSRARRQHSRRAGPG